MSLINRSIPGLFGGVSQRIPAMRHPTQCDIQDNGYCTLADGLTKRPGTEFMRPLLHGQGAAAASVQAFTHLMDFGSRGRFLLVIRPGATEALGALQIINLGTNTSPDLNGIDPSPYLNGGGADRSAYRAVTVADTTFILNRRVTVGTLPGSARGRDPNLGLAYVRQVLPNSVYRMSINGVELTVPTGATATARDILVQFQVKIEAAIASGTLSAAVTVSISSPATGGLGNVMKITCPGLALGVSEDASGDAFVDISKGVTAYSKLPADLGSGDVGSIQVRGEAVASPTYYVMWDGTARAYKEVAGPGLTEQPRDSTMPLLLRRQADNTFTVETGVWPGRGAGDRNSAKGPSFLGKKINDIFFVRNRLGFLTDSSVSLSRSGEYFSFFPESARQSLDTDPIDLDSPSADVASFEHATPYNKDMMLWALPGSQHVLTAGELMTPKTARIEQVAAYTASLGTRPMAFGSRIMYPEDRVDGLSMRILRPSLDQVSNTSEDLTEHCPRYVPSANMHLAHSTPHKLVVAASPQHHDLYLFKYEEGPDERFTQKAWQRFRLNPETIGGGVVGIHFVDSVLYIIRWEWVGANSTALFLEKLLLNSQGIHLDRKVGAWGALDVTSEPGRTSTLIPYVEDRPIVAVMNSVKDDIIGNAGTLLEVTEVSRRYNDDGTMTVTFPMDLSRRPTLTFGVRYRFHYRFTEVIMRDPQDAPLQHIELRLKKILLRFVNSGYFRAVVTAFKREPYTYEFSAATVGITNLATASEVTSGDFEIPVGSRSAGTTVDILSDSIRPCSFPYAEWVGSVTTKSQR